MLSAEELPPAPAPAAPPPPPWYLPLEGTMTLASEQLVQILPLSLLIGVSAGLLTALATKRLGMQHQSRAYAELSLLLVTALLTYTLTDEVALSGILSLFFAGVTMRHYTYYNLSPAAQATSRTLFATLASLCDIALSIILGIAVIDYLVHGWTDVRVDGVQGHEAQRDPAEIQPRSSRDPAEIPRSSRDLAEVSPRVDARVDGVHGHEARETPSFLGRLSAALGHSGQGCGIFLSARSRLDLG